MVQPPMFYQRSPDYESNMRMAEALMAQGASTAPVASPLAALARVVQGGVGGFMRDREQRRDRDRQKEYSTALAQALQAGEPWRNPDTSAMPSMNAMERDVTMGGGVGRRYLAPGEVAEGTGGMNAVIARLMGNELTAPLGTQMRLQALQSHQEQERALALERAKQAGKAPETESFFDQQGAEYKATWNPRTQLWERVGGTKALAPRNVQTVETDDGVFVVKPDGTRGQKLGNAPRPDRTPNLDAMFADAVQRGDTPEIERLMGIMQSLDPRLEEVFDPNSPTGTRWVSRSQAAGMWGKPDSGMRIEADGAGGFTFQTGRGGSSVASSTNNEIEGRMVDNSVRLDRLRSLEQSFKPEYLRWPEQLNQALLSLKERAGFSLTPEQQRSLNDFTVFRSRSFNELTQTLKELTGTAVTPQEAERALETLGDPSSDSPTEFKAKLQETIRTIRLAQARLGYIRTNGLPDINFGGVSLDQMPAIIDARGADLMRELQQANPNASVEDIDAMVMRQLGREFGVLMQ